ncbi:MAG: hypothetical protein QXV98_03630 [Thermofilaceae archaeon]
MSIELKEQTERAKDVAVRLFEEFTRGNGIFGRRHEDMPEATLPRRALGHSIIEVDRGSREHLLFITLTVALDYRRDSDKLWAAARRTFEDERTRWLFFPEEVVKRERREVEEAMKTYGIYIQKNDVDAWIRISHGLFTFYGSDPLNIVKECDFDAQEVFNKKRDQTFKKNFPYLTGDKIFALWIRMLYDVAGIQLKNLDKVPIPVDVHVARATFTTGGLTGKYEGMLSNVAHRIDKVWENAVKLARHPELTFRLQLDEPLWLLSRHGCSFRRDSVCHKRGECPVRDFCVKGVVKIMETQGGDRKVLVDTRL